MSTTRKRVTVAQRFEELQSHVLALGAQMSRWPSTFGKMLQAQTETITGHFDQKMSTLHSQQRSLEKRVRAMEHREQVRDGLTLPVPGNGAQA